MAELVAEAKVLIVHMKCEKCGKGIMERNGSIVLPTYPPKYPHKCNYCGNIENFSVGYPCYRFVPKELLREPAEDEANEDTYNILTVVR